MLGLNAEDDDGETASGRGKYTKQGPKENSAEPTPPEDQIAVEKVGKAEIVALKSLTQNLDEISQKSFLDWIKKNFNAQSIQDIPKSCFEKCIASINAKIKYLNDKNREQQQQQQTMTMAVA